MLHLDILVAQVLKMKTITNPMNFFGSCLDKDLFKDAQSVGKFLNLSDSEISFQLKWTIISPTSTNFGIKIWTNMTLLTIFQCWKQILTLKFLFLSNHKTQFIHLLVEINMIEY